MFCCFISKNGFHHWDINWDLEQSYATGNICLSSCFQKGIFTPLRKYGRSLHRLRPLLTWTHSICEFGGGAGYVVQTPPGLSRATCP